MKMEISRAPGAYVISIDGDDENALRLPVAHVEHMTKTKLMRAISQWFNNVMSEPPEPEEKPPAKKKASTKGK